MARWMVVLTVPILWLVAAAISLSSGTWLALTNPYFIASLAFYVSGSILLFKAEGNLVGWLLIGFPSISSFSLVATALAHSWGFAGTDAAWADTIGQALATVSLMPLPLMLLYFPDGRLPSRKWGVLRIAIAVAAVVGFSAALLNGSWGGDPEPGSLESPLRPLTAPAGDILSTVFFVLLTGSFLAAGASLVGRFRRASGTQRSQIKWVALAAGYMIVILTAFSGFGLEAVDLPVGELLLITGIVAIPVAVTVAVLRYRLYEIDRLISRTVSYGLVTAALVAVFLSLVFVLQILLPTENELSVAASTLAAAALFNPLRLRVQQWVDRRFNRARYDAQHTVEEFAQHLRSEVSVGDLRRHLGTVAASTVEPSHLSVWLRQGPT